MDIQKQEIKEAVELPLTQVRCRRCQCCCGAGRGSRGSVADGFLPPLTCFGLAALTLLQADLYEQIGIDPPRGVLLYGPPGTGE